MTAKNLKTTKNNKTTFQKLKENWFENGFLFCPQILASMQVKPRSGGALIFVSFFLPVLSGITMQNHWWFTDNIVPS